MLSYIFCSSKSTIRILLNLDLLLNQNCNLPFVGDAIQFVCEGTPGEVGCVYDLSLN